MAVSVGQGTLVEVEDALSTFQSISHVRNISAFDGEASEIDITDLSSTAKEFRLGLRDFGSLTIDVNRDDTDTGQARLFALQASGAVEQFRITLNTPDTGGDTFTFDGIVKSFTFQTGVDGVNEGTVSIRITGAVTFTAV
jgi:hypothetical protein